MVTLNKKIIASGKRKTAVANAYVSDGTGLVTVNGVDVNAVKPNIIKLKIMTPLILAPIVAKKIDVKIRVSGGGISSQAEAMALAIARALVKYDKKLENVFLEYDRQLLVADVRRKEAKKPNRHGKARSKRQKSYR